MGQDIRDLLQQEQFKNQKDSIRENHELRFLDKLNASLPQAEEVAKIKTLSFNKWYLSIAASVVLLMALGVYSFQSFSTKVQHPIPLSVYNMKTNTNALPSLADVSPEFKKVEDYYLTSINVELAQLKITDDNKATIDSFMQQLSRLDQEYKGLQKDLQIQGTNSQALEALIQNLQMRLELLQQLKSKLKIVHEKTMPTYQNLQA